MHRPMVNRLKRTYGMCDLELFLFVFKRVYPILPEDTLRHNAHDMTQRYQVSGCVEDNEVLNYMHFMETRSHVDLLTRKAHNLRMSDLATFIKVYGDVYDRMSTEVVTQNARALYDKYKRCGVIDDRNVVKALV